GGGESVVKNIPTVATLVKGLKLETDIGSNAYIYKDIITFLLKNPDFSNAFNMTTTINDKFVGTATAEDEGTIHVKIPKSYDSQNKIVEFINKIQQMEFDSDTAARIVLNEKTGTIIISGEVKISEVVITHSNISVNIKSALNVSQPAADSGGDTTVTEQQTTDVSEDNARLHHIPTTTNVGDLQEALNKLGVTPRDMMSIFQTLSDAGALHAELINQ
ncbi:MAG: flagellar basal body P-ring protein FlgI, partial [Lentisphaeraceae bacterium]|nr:flagellar basal body P-ring protein FlgI [Lentisphaeraceae bacterium]